MKKARKFRPSPAMVVAVLALIVALGGTAIAGGVLNKKKVNNIITNRASGLKVASAKKADDADKLGGVAGSGFQRFCDAGAIKGTLVIQTTAATPGAFTNVTGFNCSLPGNTTSSVQIRRNGLGDYTVKFLNGAGGSGSAVISAVNLATSGQNLNAESDGTPGEFHVQTSAEPSTWSLIAF